MENSIRVGDRKAGMRLLLRMSVAGPAGARWMATNVGPCPIPVRNFNSGIFVGFFWVGSAGCEKRWVCNFDALLSSQDHRWSVGREFLRGIKSRSFGRLCSRSGQGLLLL